MSILQKLAQLWATITGKFWTTDSQYIKLESSFPQAMKTKPPEENPRELFERQVYYEFRDLIILREGEVKDPATGEHIVYADSLGKPTVGWGHLVLEEDNLSLGDRISERRVEEFFKKDSQKALKAAHKQAQDLGEGDNKDFIVVLGSVNYQLGTGWARTFRNTYAHIKNKRYNDAIRNLKRSKWNSQTPTRVNDFIEVIRKLEERERNQ